MATTESAPEEAFDEQAVDEEDLLATGQVGAVSIELYRPSILESLREAWRYRSAGWALIRSSLDFSMGGTILGVWWIPIQFGFGTFVQSLIFGRVLKAPSPGGVPYFLFFSAGNALWYLFRRGTYMSMKSFHVMRKFIAGVDLPLLFIPFVGVAQAFIMWIFLAGFLAGGFVVYWFLDGTLYLNLSPEFFLAPLGLAWIVLLTASWGFFSAPIYWRARDIRYIYRMVLPFVMYVTPIIYPVSALPKGFWQTVAGLNPLAAPIELFKLGLLGTGSIAPSSIASSLFFTVAFFLVGLWILNRYSLRLVGVAAGYEDDDEDEDDERPTRRR